VLDSELTALAGESHSRAYPALVNCQLLAELEEVIQYKLMPERRASIRQAWWDRLQVSCRFIYLQTANHGRPRPEEITGNAKVNKEKLLFSLGSAMVFRVCPRICCLAVLHVSTTSSVTS